MRYLCAVFALLLVQLSVGAADDGMAVWNEWKPEVVKAAKAYVEKFATEKDKKKWTEWIEEKCETRSLETVALDWFFDNEQGLRDKNPEKIKQACFLFIRFAETNTPPPGQIRDRLTNENMSSLVEFLNSGVMELKLNANSARR